MASYTLNPEREDQIIPVQHSENHGYWCPGPLRQQDISTNDIDYVE